MLNDAMPLLEHRVQTLSREFCGRPMLYEAPSCSDILLQVESRSSSAEEFLGPLSESGSHLRQSHRLTDLLLSHDRARPWYLSTSIARTSSVSEIQTRIQLTRSPLPLGYPVKVGMAAVMTGDLADTVVRMRDMMGIASLHGGRYKDRPGCLGSSQSILRSQAIFTRADRYTLN